MDSDFSLSRLIGSVLDTGSAASERFVASGNSKKSPFFLPTLMFCSRSTPASSPVYPRKDIIILFLLVTGHPPSDGNTTDTRDSPVKSVFHLHGLPKDMFLTRAPNLGVKQSMRGCGEPLLWIPPTVKQPDREGQLIPVESTAVHLASIPLHLEFVPSDLLLLRTFLSRWTHLAV